MALSGEEKRFLIVSIIPQKLSDEKAFLNVQEVIALIESYNGEVIDIVLQKREVNSQGSYIGSGKIDEIGALVAEKNIDVVVLNGVVKPAQIFHLQTIWEKHLYGVQVWDKVDLILKIFSQHAQAGEAKFQIELATMQHMGPRIYGMGDEMSRQGGLVGTRGIGETNTERMKRHFRGQIRKVKDDLEKLTKSREMQLENRNKLGLKTASIIGYTNAGKSSLFNTLTGKNRQVKDALFVTLDTGTGKMKIAHEPYDVLVSDTIGFIRDLPPQLVQAFKSTLLESIHADLLLEVIDVSDVDMERKLLEVNKILRGMKIEQKNRIYIFNKVDKMKGKDFDKAALLEKYEAFQPQFISTKTGEGIRELVKKIGDLLV